MYHPDTATGSIHHDGSGDLPGIKDPNYNWDIRPHRDRIQIVDEHTLKVWHSILEDDTVPHIESRMVYTVNTEAAAVLEKLAAAPRIRELGLKFSGGWNETTDKKKGYFETGWAHPASWNDAILQGPHLGVSTPMIKQPNPELKSNTDWSEVDLEAMPADFIPATAYQPDRMTKPTYDVDYGTWVVGETSTSQRGTFRLAWRQYIGSRTGHRSLISALLPPGSTHVNAVHTLWGDDHKQVIAGIVCSSLLADFTARSAGSAHISIAIIEAIPLASDRELLTDASQHYLRLNCLTEAYAPLWEKLMGEAWSVDTPLRKDEERRAAQVEIDAIVALSLGVTADELCMIYRTQFPVMRRYDQEDRFDANGRRVPKEILKADAALKDGARLSEADRTWTHPQSGVNYVYEYPFRQLDREADMREAYARFEGVGDTSLAQTGGRELVF